MLIFFQPNYRLHFYIFDLEMFPRIEDLIQMVVEVQYISTDGLIFLLTAHFTLIGSH